MRVLKKLSTQFFLLTGLVLVQPVVAVDPAILQQAQQDQERQGREKNNQLDSVTTKKSAAINKRAIKEINVPPAGGVCFDIKRTTVVYNKKLIKKPSFINQLDSQCVDVRAITLLLNKLNKHFQKQGFITTRAIVPKQNLKSGILKITIQAGVVESLVYSRENGEIAPQDRRLSAAFPLKKGDLIELRKLEQGLENFNSPESQSGKFKLFPGTKLGQSQIRILEKIKKPWQMKIGLDNSGYKTTGTNKLSVDLSADNILGLNDTVTLGVNTSVDDPQLQKHSRSNSLKIHVPYKDWSYSVSASKTDFARILSGVNQSFKMDGTSDVISVGIERLLSRNQNSKHYIYTSLSKKESHNFIENIEIQTQKRKLSVFKVGWRGEKRFQNKRKLEWNLNSRIGLGVLNAMDDIPGPAIADFNVYNLNTTYTSPISSHSKYIGTLSLQFSDDELPGSEQFGAGGRYDVRGFKKDGLFGNTGAFLRNTLEKSTPHKLKQLEIVPYVGLDFGVVKNPATISWGEPNVAGAALGAKFKLGKYLQSDITYSKAFVRPDEFNDKKAHWYASISLKF